jgi:site-specific recombinase XerD
LPPVRNEPNFRQLRQVVLDQLASAHSRRAYGHALDSFLTWLGTQPLNRAALLRYKATLADRLSPSSINLHLAVIRKLAGEASERRILAPEVAAGIRNIRGARQQGTRTGNWLTADQARDLIHAPDQSTLKGKRDRALLGLLVACGLRRSEAASLAVESLQQREGRWVIVDLKGKGNRLRTVPIPGWLKETIDQWTEAAGIHQGRLFRSINKAALVWGEGLTEKVVWSVVREYAPNLAQGLAPHDLRRTCAKLCRQAGGELEQIQLLLGHASIQTTERYLGSRQNLAQAVNDHLGLE